MKLLAVLHRAGIIGQASRRGGWDWRFYISKAVMGLAGCLLIGCAAPGGIYKGYEGSPKAVENIAVLEWSTHRKRWVSHIDGKDVHEGQPFFFGIANTIAHLQPGLHTIRVHNNWGNYLSSREDVSLKAELDPGHFYKVSVEPCFDCDPFAVDFMIVDSGTGAVIEKSTRFGSETYREARRREVEECESECERSWSQCFSIYQFEKEPDKCDDKEASCKFWCDPLGTYSPFVDLLELLFGSEAPVKR